MAGRSQAISRASSPAPPPATPPRAASNTRGDKAQKNGSGDGVGELSSGQTGALRRRVLLSSTMLVAAVAGYGRRAYGACVNSGGSTYQCSGTEVTTQPITANNAAVSTLPGFSVTTPPANAI